MQNALDSGAGQRRNLRFSGHLFSLEVFRQYDLGESRSISYSPRSAAGSAMRHLLTLTDLSAVELRTVLDLALRLKRAYRGGTRPPLLARRTLALLFEKQSLRTRVSFETGMTHLGGASLYLGEDVGWGKREAPQDFSRVLSRYVDAVVIRSKKHETVVEFAKYSDCPVINGLTDWSHPCQAIADVLTMLERRGTLEGAKLAYVGDSNNVCRSLAFACGMLGVELAIGSPEGYRYDEEDRKHIQTKAPKGKFVFDATAEEAAKNADFVYTDVWASMGQEQEREVRQKAFAAYQVDGRLMKLAKSDAGFLHCLPARRGEEVTDEVMDSPNSLIVDQAENRMHAQKAVLIWLLGQKDPAILQSAEKELPKTGK
jgi:ornithine carbamoyltransferase